jgi:hypothetical protein
MEKIKMPDIMKIIVLVFLFVFFGLALILIPNLPTYITNNTTFTNIIIVLMFFALSIGFVWVIKK